jgi:hypothetical protein
MNWGAIRVEKLGEGTSKPRAIFKFGIRNFCVRTRFNGLRHASSLSNAFASFRSRVSWPSVNHPQYGASSSRACWLHQSRLGLSWLLLRAPDAIRRATLLLARRIETEGRYPFSRKRDLRGSVTPAKAGGVEPRPAKPDALIPPIMTSNLRANTLGGSVLPNSHIPNVTTHALKEMK